MKKSYILLKDKPVLEIDHYNCKILDYALLPFSLRYEGVNYDDVMHGWTETRSMSIGKTNAKKLLAGFRLRQSNPYIIAKMFHFSSLSDCYWMKEEGEPLAWKQVSLFANPLEEAVTATALMGVNNSFPMDAHKIHTPEITAQGMAAKAWIREKDGLYLYKVGKKERAASEILDVLGIDHVKYEIVPAGQLAAFADQAHIDKIYRNNEEVVKCKIISSEEKSLVPWEDFQMYCSYHDLDEFVYVMSRHKTRFLEMQIADYILGNEDRHGANFGFFMDNQTGELLDLYPLMDHDHAFSNDAYITSQTSEADESLLDAASRAVSQIELPLRKIFEMEPPRQLTPEQWEGVIKRTESLTAQY